MFRNLSDAQGSAGAATSTSAAAAPVSESQSPSALPLSGAGASAAAPRSTQVDVLRGFSILAVLLLHFSLSYGLTQSPLARLIPAWLLQAAIINGNYGVTVFFVISGFLITTNNRLRFGTLGRVRLRQFYTFRLARIAPPLMLALAVIVPLGLARVPNFDDVRHGEPMPAGFMALAALSVLTFWHNVLMERVGYFNYCLNIYWSLSVEEVFYLVFPAACLLLRRERFIVVLCALALAVGPWYRGMHRDDELYFMYGYAACFDAIAFGCLAALLYPRLALGRVSGRAVRAAGAVILIAAWLAGIEGHEKWGFTFVAFGAACLLCNAFRARGAGLRLGRGMAGCTDAIAWLGRHSYELYLFHILVLAALRLLVHKDTLAPSWKLPLLAGFLCASAMLAALVSRRFAEPVNRALRRGLRERAASGQA